MLVSYRHRLAILSMPKCASESLTEALADSMDIVIWNNPALKHTYYRRFDRFIRPFLENYAKERFETVCMFREPVDWLHSWWRYRSRPGIPDKSRSTKGVPFADFVSDYLDEKSPPADIGRQSRFVADRKGEVGVDRLFRYDRMDNYIAYLEKRLNRKIKLPHKNRSPKRNGPDRLPDDLMLRVRKEMTIDVDIYHMLAE